MSNRLPKFFAYFERVLQGAAAARSGNEEKAEGEGEWLYGGRLTYADLVLWQCMDGVQFAFPVAVSKMRKSGKYERVFGLYERVKGRENVKAYLESERRMKYSSGIYRHYPELDDQDS